VRQSFIHERAYLNYHEMHRRMKDHVAYKALPAKVAQLGSAAAGPELAGLRRRLCRP
jgi:hypothetical protein